MKWHTNTLKRINFSIDLVSLIYLLISILTGLVIQIIYHIGQHPIEYYYLGLPKSGWLWLHKYSSIFAALFLIVHILLHLKWVKNVIKKRLYREKNISINVTFMLFLISTFTIITGLLSLACSTTSGLHHSVIEIHDKLGVFLAIIFLYHFISKFKWMEKTCRALLKNH